MQDQFELSPDERQWLLAINRGPLTKPAADKSVPEQIRESLIGKRLVRWKTGFLDVTLLEITSLGAAESERLRAAK